MGQLTKKIFTVVDGRDIAVLLGLILVCIGLAMWSVPLALVVLGVVVLAVAVGPVVLANIWRIRKK